MRVPALMMAVVMVTVFGAGCAKLRPKPRTIPVPKPPKVEQSTQLPKQPAEKKEDDLEKIKKQNKERLKIKFHIKNQIDFLEKKLQKKEEELATKRAQGIDVSEAEKILQKCKDLWSEAEGLYFEASAAEDYEPVYEQANGLLRVIEESFITIKQEVSKAPRFREKAKPQPREFMDERDAMIERLGHPNPTDVRMGPHGIFSMYIPNPSLALQGLATRGCFNPSTSEFILQIPPKIQIIEYHKGVEGDYQFLFIEKNPAISMLKLSEDINPSALAQLCMSQGSGYENYEFLGSYIGKRAGSPEEVLTQLLSGRGRFADQFGLGAMASNAKGSAPLADLEVVSVVFNTKITPLNQQQQELLDKISAIVKENLGQIQPQPRGNVLVYDQERADKTKESFLKIAAWQATLSPRKRDKKKLLALVVVKNTELAKLLDSFEEQVAKLEKEFKRIREQLLQFQTGQGTEVVVYDDEQLVLSFLLRGVGFKVDEQSAKTLFKRDIPQLKIDSELLYYKSKNDAKPKVVAKNQIRITEANRYIDVSKDYQRLTSFSLRLPSGNPLPKGHYGLKLEITDEIREKAVFYEANFTVLPASLRGMKL